MILDIARFVQAETAYWKELDSVLAALGSDPLRRMTLTEIQRLHYLYERCSADLVRLDNVSTEPQLREYLETLVARAYSEIHETRGTNRTQWKNTALAFPRAFRRHLRAFQLSVAITLLGCAFGWFALHQDAQVKATLLPFSGLLGSPAERVAREESATKDRLQGVKGSFAAQLMTNNIRVTLLAMATGITYGAGTLILLFYNGVILGVVTSDYITGGQGVFLAGWLLPHGSIEIPAILLGGQAGFILAGALIGWGEHTPRAQRFRAVAPDLFAIACGAAAMLIWAGIMEAFVSQYHRPVIPYALKISLGVCELLVVAGFLGWAGRND